jgi:putative transposase
MRYRFVAAERAAFPVRALCRLVGVAVSGFYAWLRRGPARRHEEDRRVSGRIEAIFAASRGT